MLQQNGTNAAATLPTENAPAPKKLSLLDFAEILLTLPEASKREVLGYAKCLYASTGRSGTQAGA